MKCVRDSLYCRKGSNNTVLTIGGGTQVALGMCGHCDQSLLPLTHRRWWVSSVPEGGPCSDTNPGTVLVFLPLYKQKQQIQSFMHNPVPPIAFHCSKK